MSAIDGMDVGRFGVWTLDFEDQPASMMRASIQELGWQAFWIRERDGREAMTHAGFLLSCTKRIDVFNGIARIWSRPGTKPLQGRPRHDRPQAARPPRRRRRPDRHRGLGRVPVRNICCLQVFCSTPDKIFTVP
jgi:hypothetical protein